ncbi:MAG TPA: FGGY family carbohydrate kinase [Trebonia sp.]|nr:FGGY family carbohydrate kinase [Trebonia sp.]
MTPATALVIGLDIGTTSVKAVARPLSEDGAVYAERPTPWQAGRHGQSETDPYLLLNVAVELIGSAIQAAESAWGPVRAGGIGVAGMAESGVLLTGAGRPAGPVIAWFDHRGGEEIEQAGLLSPEFAAAFPGTTGLPWSSQASLAKLLWLRATGGRAGRASTWLSVPEWIVFGLGGDLVREPSLASRTGLIDQNTGELWPAAVALAGLPARILPDERPAGCPAGRVRHDGVDSRAAGAVLTVAGHDHPVAAIGAGAVEKDDLFNSSGTADVLARCVPGTLAEPQRQAVVSAGWSIGRHVLPDTGLLLAGVSGGLLLRRVLAALGAEQADARAKLDRLSLSVGDLPPGLSVAGDGRSQDDVVLRVKDGATPAAIWTAAVRYTADQARLLLDDIEPVVGPHRRAVAAGGWTRMASVRAAKAAAIKSVSFSPAVQPGVVGAALLAEFAIDGTNMSLADFIRESTAAGGRSESELDTLSEGMT